MALILIVFLLLWEKNLTSCQVQDSEEGLNEIVDKLIEQTENNNSTDINAEKDQSKESRNENTENESNPKWRKLDANNKENKKDQETINTKANENEESNTSYKEEIILEIEDPSTDILLSPVKPEDNIKTKESILISNSFEIDDLKTSAIDDERKGNIENQKVKIINPNPITIEQQQTIQKLINEVLKVDPMPSQNFFNYPVRDLKFNNIFVNPYPMLPLKNSIKTVTHHSPKKGILIPNTRRICSRCYTPAPKHDVNDWQTGNLLTEVLNTHNINHLISSTNLVDQMQRVIYQPTHRHIVYYN